MYGIALGAGLDADLLLMIGSEPRNIVEADLYRRLAGDPLATGKLAIADLTACSTHRALARRRALRARTRRGLGPARCRRANGSPPKSPSVPSRRSSTTTPHAGPE